MSSVQEKLSFRVVGARFDDFRLVEGGTLILYLASGLADRANAKMWIDCAWRVITNGRVVACSLDDSDSVLPALNDVHGRTIQRVHVDDCSKDFQLHFTEGVMIEGFCHSTQMELWELRGEDGYRLGVGEKLEMFERLIAGNE